MLVLVLIPAEERLRKVIAAAGDHEVIYTSHQDVTDDQIARADMIVGNIAPERLKAARNLKLLQLNSAGINGYDEPGVLPAGARLSSAVGCYGEAVAEHTFAMLIACMKRLPAYRDRQREHAWTDEGPVTGLNDARVLILGTGDLGGTFARYVRGFGAHTWGVRRHADQKVRYFEEIHAMDELPELLPKADVIASFLPSSPATRHLADAAFFERCRTGAYFVNAGRGDLVVTDALIQALESGKLAGAALDVTDPEPLPAEHPLWDAPNTLITPHVAGGFHLPVVLENILCITAVNIWRLDRNQPPVNDVPVKTA